VGEDGAEHVELITQAGARGHVVELVVGLELGEQALLGAAAVVEGQQGGGLDTLVGDDDLELIALDLGPRPGPSTWGSNRSSWRGLLRWIFTRLRTKMKRRG
jgi:hypothetical protein